MTAITAGFREDGSHGQAPHHSIEFKRQVALMKLVGSNLLHGLAKRHDISRNLIQISVKKLEAGRIRKIHAVPILFRSTKQKSRHSNTCGSAGPRNRELWRGR